MLFVFNFFMKSCHSNKQKKPNSAIVTWLITLLPWMRHEKIFYGKCYLVVVCQSSTYKIVKVIKLLKKIASKDSVIIFKINIIHFYHYHYYYAMIMQWFVIQRHRLRCRQSVCCALFGCLVRWSTYCGRTHYQNMQCSFLSLAQH